MAENPPRAFDDRYYRQDEIDTRVATDEVLGMVKMRGDLGGFGSEPRLLALDGIPVGQVERTGRKGADNGYAGLNERGRIDRGIDATEDIIVDNDAKGIVLKAATGEYVRVKVSVSGGVASITLTVLGAKP